VNTICRIKKRLTSTTAVAIAVAAAPTVSILGTAPVHADSPLPGRFQSPSGNIACAVGIGPQGPMTGKGAAGCEIRDYTWTAATCPGGAGLLDHFLLNQGEPAHLICDANTDPQTKQPIPGHNTLFVPGLPTLDYGQTRSAGPITCDSEPSGIKCTDSSTAHFFQVSRDSYQVG
jgi:hypothetical protein